MSQPRTTPNRSGNGEFIAFADFSRMLYMGIQRLQDWVKDQTIQGAGGKTLIGDVRHRVLVIDTDENPTLIISGEVLHPGGIGDLSWMTFKACSYALYTVCREQIRADLITGEGSARFVRRGVQESAEMRSGDATVRITVQAIDLS